MKVAIFTVFLLTLATSYASTDPLEIATKAIKNAIKALPVQDSNKAVNSRAKRSTTVSVEALSATEFNQCQATAHKASCDNGSQQRLHTLAIECRMNTTPSIAEFACSQNSESYFCSQAYEIIEQYDTSSCTLSSLFCSSSCRSILNVINAELGCCSGLFNQALSGQQNLLAGQVWQACQVTPGPVCEVEPFDSNVNSTRACTVDEYNLEAFQMRCMPEYLEQVLNALLVKPGCESLGVVQVELCGFNEVEFCLQARSRDTTSSTVTAICGLDVLLGGSCSSFCAQALMDMKDQLGCCLNTFFNGTLIRTSPSFSNNRERLLEIFSYEFWTRCDVEPPGFCPSTLPLNLTLVDGMSGASTPAAGWLSFYFLFLITVLCFFL